METRGRSANSGAGFATSPRKRGHHDFVTSPSNGSSGLTPCMRSMGMESPRKTPRLEGSSDCKLDSSGQMPTPLALPSLSARVEQEPDESMEGFECEVCGKVFDEEDAAEAHEAACEVTEEKISAFHGLSKPPKKDKPNPPTLPNLDFSAGDPAAAAEGEQEADGWSTVSKPKPRKKCDDDDGYVVPEDAYVDHDWSDDDGCYDDTYCNAKRGGNSKGKHNNTFMAASARNCQIAKRDAQRGGSKR